MEDLTPRKERILKAVVLEYVETAEPVGSNLLVERYALGVGPATVRHELAEMSERGLLEQPHTSAGRIPSDSGYRYYVDRLADKSAGLDEGRTIRSLFASEQGAEQLLSETCRLLARLTHHLSLAATLRERSTTIKQVTLTGLTSHRVLMVVVLSNGVVEDRMLEATPDLTLDDLQKVSQVLTSAVENVRLRNVSRRGAPVEADLRPGAQALLARAWKALKNLCRSLSGGKLIAEGTSLLLAQPEFQRDYQALTEVVKALEDAELLQGALEAPADDGAAVTIGRENTAEPLKRLAVIASRFYVGDEDAGAIGVIGPTRMKYEKTIPLVEETARALSDALTRLLK